MSCQTLYITCKACGTQTDPILKVKILSISFNPEGILVNLFCPNCSTAFSLHYKFAGFSDWAKLLDGIPVKDIIAKTHEPEDELLRELNRIIKP